MSAARVGCCSLFEGEIVAIFEKNKGNGGDWERLISILN